MLVERLDAAPRRRWLFGRPPGERVPGTLHFKGDHSITLELAGVLERPSWRNEDHPPEIILGFHDNGTPCTLRYCRPTTTRLGGAGHTRLTLPLDVVIPTGSSS